MRETFNGFSQKCFSVRRQKLIRRKYISVSSVCDHLPPFKHQSTAEREINNSNYLDAMASIESIENIVISCGLRCPTHCLHNGMMEKGQGNTSNANGKLSVQFRFYEISKR